MKWSFYRSHGSFTSAIFSAMHLDDVGRYQVHNGNITTYDFFHFFFFCKRLHHDMNSVKLANKMHAIFSPKVLQ